MIKRYGTVPKAGQRYTTRAGVYAILPRGGKLLLTYQGDPHFEVQLPGGGIDPGESPLRALHREVFEETGYRIAAPPQAGHVPSVHIHAGIRPLGGKAVPYLSGPARPPTWPAARAGTYGDLDVPDRGTVGIVQ